MHLLIIDKDNIPELRRFALTMSIVFPVVFMLVLPWIFNLGIPVWPALLSAVLMLLYLISPRLLHYPQIVWAWIAFVLGWINTHLLLWVVFYILIFPVGLMAKLAGKLNYNKHHKSKKESFWVKRDQKAAKQELENPF